MKGSRSPNESAQIISTIYSPQKHPLLSTASLRSSSNLQNLRRVETGASLHFNTCIESKCRQRPARLSRSSGKLRTIESGGIQCFIQRCLGFLKRSICEASLALMNHLTGVRSREDVLRFPSKLRSGDRLQVLGLLTRMPGRWSESNVSTVECKQLWMYADEC